MIESRSDVEVSRWEWVVPVLFLTLVALLQIWPAVEHPTWWLWKPGSPASDLAVTHWPNVHFARRMLWEEGRFPFWRPTIMSGTPFAANPLAALYYPPNWPLLFLPWTSPAVGFNLSALLHLSLAGAAMYGLTRRGLGADFWGGLAAGVAYQLSPKLLNHLGAGHVGWVQAWAWLPLVILSALRACQSEGVQRAKWVLAAGTALAFQFYADVRLSAYTMMAAGSLVLARAITHLIRSTNESPSGRERRIRVQIWRALRWTALSLVIFVGLSACQWLPGLALLSDTTRSSMTFSDAAVWSLPWRYLGGLLLADHGGFVEWMTYVGTSTLALAVAGLRVLWRDSSRRWLTGWLAGLGVFAAWFSMGSHGGLFQALWRIVPGLGLLRVPPRAWVLVVFVTAVLAGLGVDGLRRRPHHKSAGSRQWRHAVLLGAAAFPAMLVTGYWLTVSRPPLNLILFGLITPLAIVLSNAHMFIKLPARHSTSASLSSGRTRGNGITDRASGNATWLGAAAVILIILDLLIVNFTLAEARAPEEVFADGRAAAQWLAKQPGHFRIYSPSYSIPQHVAEKYRLQLADGVDPLQLSVYADYLTLAAGLQPQQNYSVTLPPFPKEADIRTALRDTSPDTELLGQLGVKYVAAAFPMEGRSGTEDALSFVGRFGGVFIYRNEDAALAPMSKSQRSIRLADGQVLYTYEIWPVIAGWAVSAATSIAVSLWVFSRLRRPRRA